MAAKKQEEEEERARKEKAEKGFYWTLLKLQKQTEAGSLSIISNRERPGQEVQTQHEDLEV